jgi:hypothetical protein
MQETSSTKDTDFLKATYSKKRYNQGRIINKVNKQTPFVLSQDGVKESPWEKSYARKVWDSEEQQGLQ